MLRRCLLQTTAMMLSDNFKAAEAVATCTRPFTHCGSGGLTLTIGDVTVPVPANVAHPERVAWIHPGAVSGGAVDSIGKNNNNNNNCNKNASDDDDDELRLQGGNAFFQLQDPTTQRYLRWMCQKELLRQDMCLVGEPGPALRWLVHAYSCLVRRELQCLALNRDTTESDLGQRREIRNGTLVYDDQCVVVAAREGQLLLLEGLEKVERNVLPVINNLLENREMHLENGMMLIHPERYDRLLQELLPAKRRRQEQQQQSSRNNRNNEGDDVMTLAAAHDEMRRMGFIRVSEHFRVVGITVPVPPYDGNPLDPPLRSRFQCLYVSLPLPRLSVTATNTSAGEGMGTGCGGRPLDAAESLLKLRTAIDEVNASTREFTTTAATSDQQVGSRSGSAVGMHRELQSIGSYELAVLSRQLQLFPDIPIGDVLPRAFPWPLYAQQTTATGGAAYIEEAARRRREYEQLLAACNIGVPSFEYRNDNDNNYIDKKSGGTAAAATEEERFTNRRTASRSPMARGPTTRNLREQVASLRRSTSNNNKTNAVRQPEGFNDVLRLENIRFVGQRPTAAVVGEACIAGSRGTYRLPIYLGQAGNSNAAAAASKAGDAIVVAARCPTPRSVFTPAHHHVLQAMLQLHIAGQHILLLGPTGCGKTTILHEFAHLLGYRTETMYLYADMTNKDLFQRRTTESTTGDTTWKNSILVEAALGGHIAVLDGIDKLPHGMLSSLQQLLVDGGASLYDGTVLKPQREYEILKRKMHATDDAMRERRIFPVHPAFRVVATARLTTADISSSSSNSSGSGRGRWRITHEVTSLFGIVTMPAPTQAALRTVLSQVASAELQSWCGEGGTAPAVAPEVSVELMRDVDRLLLLRDALDQMQATEPKIPQLSLRQLLHLIRFRVRYPEDFTPGVESALLLPLMATLTAGQVRQVMRSCGFDEVRDHNEPKDQQQQQQQQQHTSTTTRKMAAPAATDLQEGRRSKRHDVLTKLPLSTSSVACGGGGDDGGAPTRVFVVHDKPVLRITRGYTEKEQAMVPYIPYFHSNPVHESIIAWLAKQYAVGNNILLIGNQGVGKNKVVDAFLARIGVPRQYIQLHRDTTVGSLTINPTVEGGRVVWADSPLVKAVQQGHCLVVDEIDKAPVEVVQVLKGLIEDHEMRLRDGRQIRGPKARIIVAADNNNNNNESSNRSNNKDQDNIITMHPDFRIIVLANPPGFPFHGNDFYRECGDLFASYVMGNPDAHSQLRVLKAYGPNLPDPLLVRLIGAFQRLQKSFEEGHLTYPFSLRELIAVVKHMAAFPHDGIYEALNNVFNFDARDENTLQLVREVLQVHLSPLMSAGGMRRLLPLRIGKPLPLKLLPQPLHVPAVAASSALSSSVQLNNGVLPLPVRFLTPAECGGAYALQSVPTWREQYREADFAAVTPSSTSDGFTEWMAKPRLPFLRPEDNVLGVAATTTDSDSGTLASVAVLFARPAEVDDSGDTNSKKKRLLLAVTTPPSVASLVMVAKRLSDLPAGQVQYFDLTDLIPNAFTAAAAAAAVSPLLCVFNAEAHAASLAGVPRDWLYDAFGAPAPLVAVVDAPSGQVLLINASAPTDSLAVPTPQQQQQEREDAALSAVLPVRLTSLSGDLLPCVASVRPESGIVAMAQPCSAELRVWMNGHRVAVTLPAASIESVHFFTENLAAVRLVLAESTQKLQGVLKIAVLPDGNAKASLCLLPSGVSGTVVGFAGRRTATVSSGSTLLEPLSPDELRGAVVVPSGEGSSDRDVVYMTLDGYLADQQLWSMRVFTDTKAAAAVRSAASRRASLQVDHTHYQLLASGGAESSDHGSVVAVDFQQHTVRRFALPSTTTTTRTREAAVATSFSSSVHHSGEPLFALDEGAGTALLYNAAQQQLLTADVVAERVEHRYRSWAALLDGSVKQVGAAVVNPHQQPLPMSYSTPRKKPSGTLKHGEEDDEEHHGGNTYAGGTGGTDTAGLGGLIGPYRLDKGRPVHQVSPEAKQQVPPHIVEEARRMGKAALEERLREIGMSAKEYEQYRALQERVRAPVALVRSLLSGLKAAEGERIWLRGQTDGVWDDSKIVEGIVGERNIYKRRADSTDTNPFKSKHKKRLLFVLDVSASMYRFESMDHRLTKLLESTVMVMEAFAGFEDKIDYAMTGHNGDSACIELVPFGQPPLNQKARMEVCQRMVAHSQYCWSGDNTVEAMRKSIEHVTAEKGDAYLVFVISDANLPRYGIDPRELSTIMRSHREVQMFCIFIATLGEQASDLQAELPTGHGFECMETNALPHILKQIFMSVNLL